MAAMRNRSRSSRNDRIGPEPWSDAQIAESLAAARTAYFRSSDTLATATVMYAEQAARIVDRHGRDMAPEDLAAACTAQAQARALASIAESLCQIVYRMEYGPEDNHRPRPRVDYS